MAFEWVKTGILLVGLVINSIWDLKRKQICLWVTVGLAVTGSIFRVVEGSVNIEWILALLPGILFLFFAWVSRQKIGYGDGLVLLSLGCFLNGESMLSLSLAAGILCGIAALILIVCFHKKGDYEIPFIPFLLIGYGLERWIL